ncbi:hypothetical protein O181_099063 [Austropuccinia psidii MF-1]|uniref:Uncharacterized protein n=1 Tax=Austropuccinia psidii MF-1 TaxID=1389203 RepID=A0A9Q3JC05_9BASI|nr:hypothetical protein [Austropuccinia psidii MF-1]
MEIIIQNIQEGHAQSSKASEETKQILNLVFEEQHHRRRDRDCLDQDINKLFNVYHNLTPQPQGQVMENQYQPDDIKPDCMLMNKERSPSQYQQGDNMSYSDTRANLASIIAPLPHRPPDETPTLPPHLCPHHSLCFHTPAHTIFMLTWCTTDMLPTSIILTVAKVPSRYAPATAYHPYTCRVHYQHAPNTNYPYACVVPSRHAPDTSYPYACVVPSQHPPDTAYHRYACVVPSQHAPDTTYPYACVVPSRHAPNTTYPYARGVPPNMLPTRLILTLPYYIHSVRWLVGVHDEGNC